MESAEEYINQASLKESAGDYLGAIAEYSKLIEMNPGNAEGFSCRGYIQYAFLKNFQEAIADFDEAIKIDPFNDFAYLSRANSKNCLKDDKGAFEDYSQVVRIYEQLDPDDCDDTEFHCWMALLGRASIKQESGDFHGAVEDYTYAIKVNSTSAEAYLGRGKVKEILKDHNGAISDFSEADKINCIRTDTNQAAHELPF